jgi:hypothetical protein
MLIGALTVVIMAVVAYAFWREGPLTGFAMCFNVLVAGLLAFNFFEPVADLLEPILAGTFLEGIEDALAMMLIFLPVLMLLRLAANSAAPTHMEYPPILYRGGAVVFGLVTGYLLSGFLVCVLQTLPLPQNFLTFEDYEPGKPLRKVLPPDLVWLAMMHRLSGASLTRGLDPDTDQPIRFDRNGSFELRYSRYRRWGEDGTARQYRGEIEKP